MRVRRVEEGFLPGERVDTPALGVPIPEASKNRLHRGRRVPNQDDVVRGVVHMRIPRRVALEAAPRFNLAAPLQFAPFGLVAAAPTPGQQQQGDLFSR